MNRLRLTWPNQLQALGFRVGRLKTGTPPRLAKASIDFAGGARRDVFHVEHGDDPASFALVSDIPGPVERHPVLVRSHQRRGHGHVRAAIHRSPLYNGQIQGIGPRYCPSLEDKVMRFPDRERHQLFLEPEGLDVEEIYVNGFSMSLPAEVQERDRARAARTRVADDAATWLCGRVRLRPADGARLHAARRTDSGTVFRRPDQRHVGLRGSRGSGSGRRPQRRAVGRRASRRRVRSRRGAIWASWSTTWSPRAASSRTGCSRRAPSIACSCAPTTPTCD